MARKKVRYTIDLTEELNAEIDAMARDAGMTKSEVFRRGLGLFKVTQEARRNREHVGVAKDQDSLKREFIL